MIPYIYEQELSGIDILIDTKSLVQCQKLLLDNGFIQGCFKDQRIQPATGEEKIMSRKSYREAILFFKLWKGNVHSLPKE